MVVMKEWDLQLSKKIVVSRKHNSFMSALTKGRRSSGKSCYNIKGMAHAHFIHDGMSEDDAWQKAIDDIIFRPDELTNRVRKNIKNDEISLCWCIDDAAVHFSSHLFFINIFQNALLNATFDTIRTVVTALLVNCPSKLRLMKALREYDDFEIALYRRPSCPNDSYSRKAVCIQWYSLPDGKRKFRKSFEDYFSCYIPDWVYNKYMYKRKKYLETISDELDILYKELHFRKSKYYADKVEKLPININ